MSEVIQLFAEFSINEGKTAEVRALLSQAVEATQDNDGVRSYQFYFSDDGRTAYFCELYRDAKTLQEHMAASSEAMAQLFELAKPNKLILLGAFPDSIKQAFAPMNPIVAESQLGFTR